jgi:kynurenine formamidase
MVGIGSPSDPYDTDDEESTIQQIISQAQDSITLQQISAINCSSFTHSDLPTDLESRFLKLKSFPANHTTPPPYVAKASTFSNPPKKKFQFFTSKRN